MNLFDRQIVWLAALLLGGCATMSPPPSPPPGGPPGACASWRWIARKANAEKPCPLLLNQNRLRELNQDRPREEKPHASPQFCVYEQQDGLPVPLEERLKQEPMFEENFSKDCAVVGPLGAELLSQSWEQLQEHFDAQVGRSELSGMRGEAQRIVRLAILDTQPKDGWKIQREGRSLHGWSLAHMGRRLVCPDGDPAVSGPCVAEVTTRLALPWWKFNPNHFRRGHLDERKGGYFGTMYDLAKAIERELEEVGPDDRLVLNLSVGWDERVFEEIGSEREAVHVLAEVLYRALENAACQGALVIAAAGNRLGGPEPETGMLLPAAWADSKAACEDGSWRPLLYAVGGVDSASRPLSNTRTEGMPELVAFADHAVVETLDPGQPTKTYTGSSVAAVVASAAAAAVWSEHPEWTAREVMETLYDSGSELAEKADVLANPPLGTSAGVPRIAALSPLALAVEPAVRTGCTNPPCVHRICFRRALCKAQGADGSACRGVDETCSGSEPPDLDLVFNPKDTVDVSGYTETRLKSEEDCRATHVMYMPESEPSSCLCPSDRFESALARPWTGPQPQDPPCPNCTLEPPPPPPPESTTGDSFAGLMGLSDLRAGIRTASTDSYTLYIEIDSDWSEPLYDATLRLGETLLPLSLGVLTSGATATVEGIDADLVNGADPIVLEFVVCENPAVCEDPKSVENPVLVVR